MIFKHKAVLAFALWHLQVLCMALLLMNLRNGVLCVETVSVLTTNSSQMKDWRIYSTNADYKWRISSASGPYKKVSQICNVEVENTDSWLYSPIIGVDSTAKSLKVQLKFTARTCELHPNPQKLRQCKENIDLMVFQSNSSTEVAAETNSFNASRYTKMATVAPDIRWSDPPITITKYLNRKEYSLQLQPNASVRIALRDAGACIALMEVYVYYLLCPRHVIRHTVFPQTPAAHGVHIQTVRGQCVPNAELKQPGAAPMMVCKADGSWSDSGSSQSCHCSAGYSPDGRNNCLPCPALSYKDKAGSHRCKFCPPDTTVSSKEGATSCSCKTGYFRTAGDSPVSDCTKPPNAPSSASAVDFNDGTGRISWQQPDDSGGRRDLMYFIECSNCGSSTSSGHSTGLTYIPGQLLANHSVLVRGLRPDTVYEFRIYARNGVSAAAGADHVAWRAVKLRVGSVASSKITSIRMEIVSPTVVQLTWDRPQLCSSNEYQVKVFPKLTPTKAGYYLAKQKQFRLNDLDEGTTYLVLVRCRLSNDRFGEYSDAISINTKIPSEANQLGGSNLSSANISADKSVHIIIGAVVAVLLCLVIVLTMIILMSRRGFLFAFGKSKMLGEKSQTTDCGMLPYSSVGTGFQLPHQSLKPYIDPHTYEDPGQAIQEFAKEIDSSWITIDCVLGGGEFGDVCKGVLHAPGREEKAVAIKTLKPGASDKNKLDFLTEASIMGQFDDPNVICLEGVVTRSHPAMIVTEYMANGSLDAFLRNHDGELSSYELVKMLHGIASGMRYLSDMSFIHRDLAARNILVNQQLVCKVADFGLSREVEADTYSRDGTYTTRGGKIPIRWTAPEAIHFRKFTTATDVWSFGIVMWEVMAFGERPYWNWSNQDVVAAVENGYRLPPPMDCPECVHSLMLQCWQWERSERPRFSQLVPAIEELLMQPHLLSADHNARRICEPPATLEMRALSSRTTVNQWLANSKLERYAELFYRFGVNSMETVQRLTAADLHSMGITSATQQKRLLHAVHDLKLHVYEATPYSDGYMV